VLVISDIISFPCFAKNVFFPKRITSYYLVFRFAQSTILTTKTNMAIYWFSRIPIITSWLYGYMLAISNPETEKQILLYGYILAISHPGIIESRNKKHIWIYGYTNDGLPRTQASSPTSGELRHVPRHVGQALATRDHNVLLVLERSSCLSAGQRTLLELLGGVREHLLGRL
jgi:hypothetical protein